MPDLITVPNRNTANDPYIHFVGLSAWNNLTPAASSIKLYVLPEGQVAYIGENGSLFTVTDSLTGVLMSIGDISGLPIFEVSSDDKIVMGAYSTNALIVSGAFVGIKQEPDATYALSVSGDVNLNNGGYYIDGVSIYTMLQNSQSANYTTVLADAGKHILHPSADVTTRTFTIASNASVPYPIGTAITFVNQNSAGTVTIAITSDTMRLAGAGTTGSRTLAANGIATALKITATEWIINGTGLT